MSAPKLPPPQAPAIYVGAPQGQIGPLPLDALLQQVAAGQLPPDAQIWFDGLPTWIRMGDHPELRDRLAVLRGAPPPPAATAPRVDDELNRRFGALVKASWAYYEANRFAHHVDEVF